LLSTTHVFPVNVLLVKSAWYATSLRNKESHFGFGSNTLMGTPGWLAGCLKVLSVLF